MKARFSERPAARQRGWVFMAVLGTVGIVAALGLTVIGFNAPNSIPGRSYYNVHAEFVNADNLTGHYQVRMGGKLVGQVLNPRVDHGKAKVDLQLDPTVRPLRSDTRLVVRPRSPVGVRYVEIIPGLKGTPLADSATIPSTQTKSTIQLDTVLGTLTPVTRLRARDFMQGFGGGLAGRGDDLNDTIGAAPQFLGDTRTVLKAVADRTGSVRSFIGGAGTIAEAADPVRNEIADGFKPGSDALQPFITARQGLQNTLTDAPATFETASAQLPRVNNLLSEVSGFAKAVRPVLNASPRAFGQTRALLVEARPGLRDLKSTLKLADKAVDPTLDFLHTTQPVLPNIDATLKPASPLVATLGAYGCNLKQFGDNWTSMMGYAQNGDDDLGVLRFDVTNVGPESAFGWTSKSELGTGYLPNNAYPEPCQAGKENFKPVGTR